MRQIKKSVQRFWREHDLWENPLTLETLIEIIRAQGFKTVFFSVSNPPDIQALIETLGLQELCNTSKGFTYCQNDIKLVFVKRTLNDQDKLSTLLHEEGHIYLEHFFRKGNLEDTSTQHENEASAFALLISHKLKKNRITHFAKTPLHFAVTSLLILLLIASKTAPSTVHNPTPSTVETTPAVTAAPSQTESTPSSSSKTQVNIRTYYWAQNGIVYHMYPNCQHLKNSVTVKSGSQQETGKDRCCKTCYSRYLRELYED